MDTFYIFSGTSGNRSIPLRQSRCANTAAPNEWQLPTERPTNEDADVGADDDIRNLPFADIYGYDNLFLIVYQPEQQQQQQQEESSVEPRKRRYGRHKCCQRGAAARGFNFYLYTQYPLCFGRHFSRWRRRRRQFVQRGQARKIEVLIVKQE